MILFIIYCIYSLTHILQKKNKFIFLSFSLFIFLSFLFLFFLDFLGGGHLIPCAQVLCSNDPLRHAFGGENPPRFRWTSEVCFRQHSNAWTSELSN